MLFILTRQSVAPRPAHGYARVVQVANAVVSDDAVLCRLQENTAALAVDMAAILYDAVRHFNSFGQVRRADSAACARADPHATRTWTEREKAQLERRDKPRLATYNF